MTSLWSYDVISDDIYGSRLNPHLLIVWLSDVIVEL
jgi:hypothetical protein